MKNMKNIEGGSPGRLPLLLTFHNRITRRTCPGKHIPAARLSPALLSSLPGQDPWAHRSASGSPPGHTGKRILDVAPPLMLASSLPMQDRRLLPSSSKPSISRASFSSGSSGYVLQFVRKQTYGQIVGAATPSIADSIGCRLRPGTTYWRSISSRKPTIPTTFKLYTK